jgi:hypothetical protein
MRIQLDADWEIEDALDCYILQKDTHTFGAKGSRIYSIQLYLPTLDSALTHYARRSVASSDEVVALKEYVDRVGKAILELRRSLEGKTHYRP